MNTLRLMVALGGVAAIGGDPVAAQVAPPATRMWSISLASGVGVGTSAGEVEAAMRAGGFDDPSDCLFFCSGTVAHPFSELPGPMTLLTVRRRLGRFTHVQAVIGSGPLAETIGYKDPWVFLFLRQSVTTYALMGGLSRPTTGSPWVAAGLAWYRVAVQQTEMPGGSAQRWNRLGGLVAAGLSTSRQKRVFLELQGQYRLVGTVQMGPIVAAGALLPRTDVHFNHVAVLLGLGAGL